MKRLLRKLPPIVPYLPNDYGADNQIWDISQSAENYIYAANTQGLLEFNGASWRLYSTPNNSIIRSVKVIENRIFTGCFMDFGFWERDLYGNLNYTSLTDLFGLKLQEDEEFWNISELDGWMIFQSYSRIYLLNLINKDSKIIKSDARILKMINFEDMIYFQKSGIGLFKIKNGNVVLVNNEEILRKNEIIEIFKVDKKMLILTNNSGIYILDNGDLKDWEIDDELNLKGVTLYSAAQLNDETLILGTISNGIFHLDTKGNLIGGFNQKNGLTNNTILSIFEDSQNDIWLGLDYGINYINRNSKFKVFYSKQGQLGTIYNAIMYNSLLYLGTNQGLFYKIADSSEEFKFVEGTNGQVWSLKEIDGQLFCGHDKGTFIIDNAQVIDKITEAEGTWDFKSIPNNENLILQGNYGGLNILEKYDGNWKFQNTIDGIDMSCRFFEIQGDKIFINHEFKGLFEVNYNSELNKAQSLNITNTVDKGIGSSLLKYSDDLIYSSSEGVFKYDEDKEFVKDSIFSSLFSSYNSLSTLLQINGEPNKIWRFAEDNILIISPGSVSSKPQIETIPISESLRNVVAGFENLSKISNDEYLIGTSNGYLIYDKSLLEPTEDYKIGINSVKVNKLDETKSQLNLTKKPELDNNTNNIEFNFSVPFYGEIVKSKYQYQLVGLSDHWSPWSTEPNQIFENLSFGKYTFNVRGKIGNKISSNIASFSFEINRPWYLTNLSLIIYAILSIFLILIIHNFYKSYYVNQQTKLLEDAQRTIDMKELESNQKLMELKNDKLKQDIENKNRELAISTMSLIKKNEFLNQIKNELNKAESPKINSVIKLINTNINNTDDWKFFEEAFNNADKDFLKKIKILHPNLTPNDLKLCAYLRLNLSSKEIAPLLNISSRSVEVKRYRLRKKMDLPHEYSLTNYILEI